MDRLTHVQLKLIRKKDRPECFDEIVASTTEMHKFKDRFDQPQTWQYYDELVPAWFNLVAREEQEAQSSSLWD